MEVKTVSFEEPLIIIIQDQKITLTPFLIPDDLGNIKFGINAPRGMAINREEIYKRKQEKLKQNEK